MKTTYIVMAQYVATFIAAIMNNIFLSPRVIGRQNLKELIKLKDEKGLGVVFISNHINAGDPFVETAMFPIKVKKTFFPVYYLTAHDKFDSKIKSFFMYLFGCVPVGNGKGENVREIIKRIKSGKNIFIFPEGHVSRNGKEGDDMGGLAYFNKFSSFIVQPIRIDGLKPFWDFKNMFMFQRKVEVIFGKPFVLEKGSDIDAMKIIAALKHQQECDPALAQKPQFEAGE